MWYIIYSLVVFSMRPIICATRHLVITLQFYQTLSSRKCIGFLLFHLRHFETTLFVHAKTFVIHSVTHRPLIEYVIYVWVVLFTFGLAHDTPNGLNYIRFGCCENDCVERRYIQALVCLTKCRAYDLFCTRCSEVSLLHTSHV